MVARSKKDIEKAHALNKRVRREKAKLRKRDKAKHSRYDKYITLHIEVPPEIRAIVNEEAKRKHISPQKVVSKALAKMMALDWENLKNGVQKKSDIKMDESTEQ